MKPIVYQGLISNWANIEVIENSTREPKLQLCFRSGRVKHLGFNSLAEKDEFVKGLIAYLSEKQIEPVTIEGKVEKKINKETEKKVEQAVKKTEKFYKGAKK